MNVVDILSEVLSNVKRADSQKLIEKHNKFMQNNDISKYYNDSLLLESSFSCLAVNSVRIDVSTP